MFWAATKLFTNHDLCTETEEHAARSLLYFKDLKGIKARRFHVLCWHSRSSPSACWSQGELVWGHGKCAEIAHADASGPGPWGRQLCRILPLWGCTKHRSPHLRQIYRNIVRSLHPQHTTSIDVACIGHTFAAPFIHIVMQNDLKVKFGMIKRSRIESTQ